MQSGNVAAIAEGPNGITRVVYHDDPITAGRNTLSHARSVNTQVQGTYENGMSYRGKQSLLAAMSTCL
jgi:hypothetical protein